MKRTAIYPGSFNPWHKGHSDILRKALHIFDEVIVLQCWNSDKPLPPQGPFELRLSLEQEGFEEKNVRVNIWSSLLPGAVQYLRPKASAIIRGIRNGHDLQYETNQQYWYEDLGLKIPVVLFITDRTLSHISSSAIRAIKKINGTTSSKN